MHGVRGSPQRPATSTTLTCALRVDLPVRKTVNVPLSTDKGMCGGINTGVAKLANACVAIDMEGAYSMLRICLLGCPIRIAEQACRQTALQLRLMHNTSCARCTQAVPLP